MKIAKLMFFMVAGGTMFSLGVANAASSESIALDPGWNIISTPRIVANHSFSALENSSNFDIFVLDASNPAGWSTMAGVEGQSEFTPLYGYFINNKTTSTQVLTLNYKDNTTPNERLFERNFNKTGWYSIGVSNPTYARNRCDVVSNSGNVGNVLYPLSGKYSSVVDFTNSVFNINPNSVAVGSAWKAVVPTDLVNINDFRELKAYAVYINQTGAVYSGFQNTTDPVVCTPTITASLSTTSPSTNIIVGNANQALVKFNLLASGAAIKINQLDFQIIDSTSTTVLRNIRIVDDQGLQLGTTQASITGSSTFSAGSGSLNYIIPQNITRVLTVYADVDSNATGTIQVNLTGGTSQSYFVPHEAVVIGNVSGNVLSVSSPIPNLLASLNYALGTPIVVAGASQAKIASFNLTAGQINSVNMTGITVSSTANTTLAGWMTALTVKVNGVQAGNAQPTVTANQPYTFNAASTVAINPGATAVVDVYANLSNSATATSGQALVSLASVNATNNVGNSVSITAVTGQNVNITTGGVATSTVDAATPNAAFVGMGVSGITVAKFRFTTDNNGSAVITNIALNDIGSSSATSTVTTDRSFTNYKLYDGTTLLATGTENASSSISFPLAGVTVPVSSYKTLSLVADSVAYPSASSAAVHAYKLNSYTYNNAAGATTTSIASSSASFNSNNFTVYRTTLGVSSGPSYTAPAGLSDGAIVGQFTFAAGSGYDAVIKTVNLSQAGNLLQSSSSVLLTVYGSNAPSTVLATSTVTSTNTMTFTLNGSTGWTVPAGQSYYLIVKANLVSASNLVTTSPSTRSYQIAVQASTWNDGVANVSSLDPSITLPINGQTNTFSF